MNMIFWVGPLLAAMATMGLLVVTARASTRAQARRRRANRLDLPPGWESLHSVPVPQRMELRPVVLRRT